MIKQQINGNFTDPTGMSTYSKGKICSPEMQKIALHSSFARGSNNSIIIGLLLIMFSVVNAFAGIVTTDSPVGLWGYKNNIRLCENANELFQAYVDVNRIPELEKAVKSGESQEFTIFISFPRQVKFISPISDDIWLFPKWACKNPAVKSEVTDNRLLVSHTFSSENIKNSNGRYGFGFLTKNLKRGESSKVEIWLSNGSNIIESCEYNLEFLPPIKAKKPDKLLVQLAYYPRFSEDLLKETFAENTINAGFNDLMIIHNGSAWQNMKDVKMMRNSGMRIIVNFFTSGIFKDFPFEEYPEWNETDKDGKIKMRHRDLDMQKIIEREPVIIKYLEDYFSDLKNSYDIDGIQMDEERSPLGGFTRPGIEAFREWAGFKDDVKLDVYTINNNYMEMWISFRNRQVAKTFDVIQETYYRACGKMPIGYYGAPQVDFGKNYSWAHKHYVACWYLLQGRADWGGAGYGFSMATMRNTYDRFGKGRFIPWYMVTENYNEKWRRYREISASLVQHLIASGMNGFAIWYYILDNGAFYDVSCVNNMLSEYEDIFTGGVENSALLVLDNILPGDMTQTVYSQADKHVAVLANIKDDAFTATFFWRGCDQQPVTTLRYADGETSVIQSGATFTIPAKSFVTLVSRYNAENINLSEIEENVPFKTVFSQAGEKTFFIKNYSDVYNCDISAEITVDTDSEDFGELCIVARDSGKDRILGGVILSKKIAWAHARDVISSEVDKGYSESNYIRHAKNLNKEKIKLRVKGNQVILEVAGKSFEYNTKVKRSGRIGFTIKANNPGTCIIEKLKVLNLDNTDKENGNPAKERKKRELRKGEPQV